MEYDPMSLKVGDFILSPFTSPAFWVPNPNLATPLGEDSYGPLPRWMITKIEGFIPSSRDDIDYLYDFRSPQYAPTPGCAAVVLKYASSASHGLLQEIVAPTIGYVKLRDYLVIMDSEKATRALAAFTTMHRAQPLLDMLDAARCGIGSAYFEDDELQADNVVHAFEVLFAEIERPLKKFGTKVKMLVPNFD